MFVCVFVRICVRACERCARTRVYFMCAVCVWRCGCVCMCSVCIVCGCVCASVSVCARDDLVMNLHTNPYNSVKDSIYKLLYNQDCNMYHLRWPVGVRFASYGAKCKYLSNGSSNHDELYFHPQKRERTPTGHLRWYMLQSWVYKSLYMEVFTLL